MKCSAALFTPLFEKTYSGVGTYARMLVAGLKAAGAEVYVVSADCHDAPPHCIRVKNLACDITPNRWLSNSVAYSRVLARLKGKVDIMHFLDARELAFVKRPAGVRIIGSVHDTYSADLADAGILREHFFDWKKRLLYYNALFSLEKKTYARFDFLVANTGYVKDRLTGAYGIPSGRTGTVYYGAPLKNNYGEDAVSLPYTVSFIGGNFQRKGLVPLAKALLLLRKEGMDIRLSIAGHDTKQKVLDARLKALGCEGFVDFRGYVPPEKIPDFLRASHVFAMPSLTEAFGLVYLEAMACGVPALGTENGGTRELIRDGWNGFLCNPFDIGQIADKIRKALDANIRREIIPHGHETVEQFTVERSIKGLTEIYRKTLGS